MPFSSILFFLLWNQGPVEAITVENMDHLDSYTLYRDHLDCCPILTLDDAHLLLYTNFDIFVNGFRLYTTMLTKRAILDAADAERFVYLFPLIPRFTAPENFDIET